MYSVKVKVKPDIYYWVKNQVNIETLKLCMKENFKKWIAGEKDEKNELIEYRTIDSVELEKPSRNLIDTIHEMENIQEWMKEYIIKNSNDKVDFIASADLSDNVKKTVNSIRKKLFLKIDWYKDSKNSDESFKLIRKKLENAGVIVMMNGVVGANTKRKLNIDEFRAFTLIDEYAEDYFLYCMSLRIFGMVKIRCLTINTVLTIQKKLKLIVMPSLQKLFCQMIFLLRVGTAINLKIPMIKYKDFQKNFIVV